MRFRGRSGRFGAIVAARRRKRALGRRDGVDAAAGEPMCLVRVVVASMASSRDHAALAGARLCVISGPVLSRVVVGARPGHAPPAKCEVARDTTLFETTHGQRRHAPRSMFAARTAGRTTGRPQTPNAQAAPVEGRCSEETWKQKTSVRHSSVPQRDDVVLAGAISAS